MNRACFECKYPRILIYPCLAELLQTKFILAQPHIEENRLFFYNKHIMRTKLRFETKIIFGAIGFRLAVYIFSVVVLALLENYENQITFSDFLAAWTRWDSQHYIDVAAYGYSGAVENGEHLFLVFYQLLPWLLRAMHVLIGDYRLCGLLLDTFCFCVGSVYFYRLTEREYGSQTANNALILLAVFPFSFFFGAVLTESLFFALSAMFLYYLRSHKWLAVAVLGFLACLTKTQGCMLAFAVAAELLVSEKGLRLLREKKWKEFGRRILCPGMICSLMVLGFAVYLGINRYVEGDCFRFLYYQKNHWHNAFCPIWETFSYLVRYSFGSGNMATRFSIWIPELILFVVWIVWIGYGIKRRLPAAYMVYLIVLFLLTYSSTWLLSGGRYALCALPGFMLVGDWLTRHEKWKMPTLIASSMLLAVYLTGYLLGRQIM